MARRGLGLPPKHPGKPMAGSPSCGTRARTRAATAGSRLPAHATVLRMVDEGLIQEAGRRLREAAPGAQVIFFGSGARGDGGPHSDLDFLVVERDLGSPAEESVRLRHALRDLLVPMDIVVVSQADVDKWRGVRGSLVHAALADGRVLAA